MEKKKYSLPIVELIVLDNEISLALQSAPPAGPYETNVLKNTSEFFNNDPYNKLG